MISVQVFYALAFIKNNKQTFGITLIMSVVIQWRKLFIA